MNRRGFLAGILAAGTAPAIVRAESLMKIFVPKQEILLPSAMDIAWSVADINSPNLIIAAEYEWKQLNLVIERTFQANQEQIIANAVQRNPMLQCLKRKRP
jgi:hypothetical protein